jgi:hypothetical protein
LKDLQRGRQHSLASVKRPGVHGDAR